MPVSIATSKIVSQAFRHLEQSPIASFSETHPHAVAAAEQYDPAVRAALTLHDWSFARQVAVLPPLVDDSVVADPDLAYIYALPGDFVALRLVPDGVKHREDAGVVRADQSGGLRIRYTQFQTNENRWPQAFRDLVSLGLALRLRNLLPNRAKRRALKDDFEEQFQIALLQNQQTASPHDFETGEALEAIDWAQEAIS